MYGWEWYGLCGTGLLKPSSLIPQPPGEMLLAAKPSWPEPVSDGRFWERAWESTAWDTERGLGRLVGTHFGRTLGSDPVMQAGTEAVTMGSDRTCGWLRREAPAQLWPWMLHCEIVSA